MLTNRMAYVSLGLAILTAGIASAADTVKAQETKPGAPTTAASNALAEPWPQLSANTNTGPEVPLAPDTNLTPALAARPANPTPSSAPGRRNPLWVVAAVVAVLVVRFALRRFLFRSPQE